MPIACKIEISQYFLNFLIKMIQNFPLLKTLTFGKFIKLIFKGNIIYIFKRFMQVKLFSHLNIMDDQIFSSFKHLCIQYIPLRSSNSWTKRSFKQGMAMHAFLTIELSMDMLSKYLIGFPWFFCMGKWALSDVKEQMGA